MRKGRKNLIKYDRAIKPILQAFPKRIAKYSIDRCLIDLGVDTRIKLKYTLHDKFNIELIEL